MNAQERVLGRAVAATLLVVAAVVVVATSHERTIGQYEMAAADAAFAKADWPDAITHARAAAEAMVPASPWPALGLRRLVTIGYSAETRDDEPTALLAYGAILTAEQSTRVPVWPERASSDRAHFRALAEEGLARVAAGHPDPPGAPITTEAMLEALHHDDTPGCGTWVILTCSTLATLGALAWLALLGSRGRGGKIAGIVATAGFVVYAATLMTS